MFCIKPEACPWTITGKIQFDAHRVCINKISIAKVKGVHLYSEKESSLGSGKDDSASLAGNESASVLSNIFSRFAFESDRPTKRSSGSLPGLVFDCRFLGTAFLRRICLAPVLAGIWSMTEGFVLMNSSTIHFNPAIGD